MAHFESKHYEALSVSPLFFSFEFFSSIYRHFDADIVLFINNPITELTQSILTKYKVTTIPFELTDLPIQMRSFHPSTYRWYLIYQFFQKNVKKYRNVWMIDVRDSYFQSNPFDFINSNPSQTSQFHVFQGVDLPIGQCGWNGPWISDCFGNEVYQNNNYNYLFNQFISILNFIISFSFLLFL